LRNRFIVLAAIILLVAPLAFSQSRETGALQGKVTDEQGSPLPGVNITASSPNLMGVRTAVTDADGEFRFIALPPGVYEVKAELQGFGTVLRKDIRLTTTTRLIVDFQMKAAAVAEEVTVIAQSPTVDIKSTETASVTLGNEILRNIPNSQFSTDIVNMAPGVTSDVAYGAGDGRGISYQMDGVGVGDPDGGTAWVFVDYNIIEEAKVMGHGLPAEYGNFTGVIFNIITKSGGNQLSGHFEVDFQGRKTRGIEGEENYLKGDFLPALWGTENNGAYVGDWPEVTSPLEKLLDANAHLGGPIIKDKLWFFTGAQWYNSKDYPTGFPLAQNYKQPRFFLKLNSQASAKTSLSASFEYDDYDGTNRDAGANVNIDATTTQIDPEFVLNFNLTQILSPKTFFDVKAAYFNGYYNLEPISGRDVSGHYFYNDNPDIPGDQTHMRYFNVWRFAEHPRTRFQANASLTHYAEDFIQGSHDFKFGVEFEHSRVRNLYSYTGVNHMYYYDYWGGGYYGNYSANQYVGYNASTRLTRFEAFAQDSWQITKRLNLSLGLRASQIFGKVKELGVTSYKAFRIAPRIGFTFDLLGDKTTILKGHYGEFTDGVYGGILDRLSPTWSDKVYLYWDPEYTDQSDPNGWYEYDRAVHGTWTIDEGIKHPFMRQFTVGVERELFKDASFSVTYINKTFHNFIGPYNALATYEAVPYEADYYDPVNDRVVTGDFTLYNRTSDPYEAEWHLANMEKTKDLFSDVMGGDINPYRKYWGVEFLFNKRFSNRWQFIGSYVYSKTRGTITNSTYDDIGWGDTNDPNYWVNADGYVGIDPRHMIKLQGTYMLPLDIAFKSISGASRGGAYTQRYRTGRSEFDQGRITFMVEPRGTYHYPMVKTLDLRLEKVFTIASKYRLGLMFDVFNLFNDNTITSWGNRIGYDWIPRQWLDADEQDQYTASTQGHELLGLVLPRRARVGIRLIF